MNMSLLQATKARAAGILLIASTSFIVGAALPAFAATGPGTTPTLTEPLDSATVGGIVSLSASTTAPNVQFMIDGGPLGAPVAALGGEADTTWSTWGLANSGSHTVQAADCDETGCSDPTAAISVTVQNNAPVLTNPIDSESTGAATTMTATADGGGVKFKIDGADAGFDGTAALGNAYSLDVTDLTEGSHTASVVSCNEAGDACNGPATSNISFTVEVLHPSVDSVASSPFSPNGDGKRDTTTATFTLPDPESVSLTVHPDGDDTVVRGPIDLGLQTAGVHTYTWNGMDNGSARVADGTYDIQIDTSAALTGSEVARGTAENTVVVDDTAPALSSVSGANYTFYPYHDGYKDTFRPSVTLAGTPATLYLEIRNDAGHVIRIISASHNADGRFSITWDSKTSSGARVSPGTYGYRFFAEDSARNRRYSSWNRVYVSGKKLVTETTAISKNGNSAYQYEATDTSCTGYSFKRSNFAHGVWLVNVCSDVQLAVAEYDFALPAAISYSSIYVKSYGNTISAPEEVLGTVWNYNTSQWDPGPVRNLTTAPLKNAWLNLGSFSATNRIHSHHVHVGFVLSSATTPADYDIDLMQVVVTYKVLK
jgi:flagellar basal-body rod modification protein FlgD